MRQNNSFCLIFAKKHTFLGVSGGADGERQAVEPAYRINSTNHYSPSLDFADGGFTN
jgi:hypothetical protein